MIVLPREMYRRRDLVAALPDYKCHRLSMTDSIAPVIGKPQIKLVYQIKQAYQIRTWRAVLLKSGFPSFLGQVPFRLLAEALEKFKESACKMQNISQKKGANFPISFIEVSKGPQTRSEEQSPSRSYIIMKFLLQRRSDNGNSRNAKKKNLHLKMDKVGVATTTSAQPLKQNCQLICSQLHCILVQSDKISFSRPGRKSDRNTCIIPFCYSGKGKDSTTQDLIWKISTLSDSIPRLNSLRPNGTQYE